MNFSMEFLTKHNSESSLYYNNLHATINEYPTDHQLKWEIDIWMRKK